MFYKLVSVLKDNIYILKFMIDSSWYVALFIYKFTTQKSLIQLKMNFEGIGFIEHMVIWNLSKFGG